MKKVDCEGVGDNNGFFEFQARQRQSAQGVQSQVNAQRVACHRMAMKFLSETKAIELPERLTELLYEILEKK